MIFTLHTHIPSAVQVETVPPAFHQTWQQLELSLRPRPFISTYRERKGLYFEEKEDISNAGMVCPRCLLDVKGVLRDQTRLREVIQYQALHKMRRSPRLRPRKKNGKTLIKSHLQNRRKKLFNNFHLTFLILETVIWDY